VLAVLLGTAADNHGVDAEDRYIYKDSSSPFGPAVDPEPAGGELTFAGDDDVVDVTLPFEFDLFDETYAEASIGVNGALSFTPGEALPGANGDLSVDGSPIVAPWWDDWELGPTGSVSTRTFGPAVDQTFVVRWVVRPAGGGDDDFVDFEVLLREREDLVEFQYVDTDGGGDGASGTIGLGGFEYSQDEAVLDDAGFAIRWTPVFCHGHRATRLGTFGNDSITGTPGRDVIVSLSGFDRVWAKGGNDVVCGSRGEDRLDGGYGADELWGESAPDQLLGGYGRDRMIGGARRDLCVGGPGADTRVSC
jgi:Ca2+-binding RTX toxin-like protein